MPSTKYKGLNYPTHFLKSRGSVMRKSVLEYRTNQATLFARQNDFYALFTTNKAKIYLIGFFHAPVEYKQKLEKVQFLTVYHSFISHYFQM